MKMLEWLKLMAQATLISLAVGWTLGTLFDEQIGAIVFPIIVDNFPDLMS